MLLISLIKPFAVHESVLAVVLDTESQTLIFAIDSFVVFFVMDLNDSGSGQLRNWFQLKKVVFSSIRGGAVVEDLLVCFVKWSEFYTDILVFIVIINVDFRWDVHLNVLVISGDVVLVVKWSNKTNLSLSLGRNDKFDFASQIKGFWYADFMIGDKFWMRLDTDLTVQAKQNWSFQGVYKWNTHDGWETKRHLTLVQEFGVVEVDTLVKIGAHAFKI